VITRTVLIIVSLFYLSGNFSPAQAASVSTQTPWWNFQAIDTMKYSRDPSREFLGQPSEMKRVASEQIAEIAKTGATHVGIATPYDEEFLPILVEWVTQARQAGLHIWFRGNWSGWESWFGYPKISREEHLNKTITFIKDHPELFEDGDVFSACPECENGGPGDPRFNGDAAGHRAFLINEYQAMNEAFRGINRNVQTNYNSMNGDVARLIMDQPTTQALGGLVVVDHYVRTPEKLNQDVSDFAARSGGKVILGEFGAPIPDINGRMTDQEQAAWLQQTLQLLSKNPDLVGLSYWTNMGGSTAIWDEEGQPKPAVNVLTNYFKPLAFQGVVTNEVGQTLSGVEIATGIKKSITNKSGTFALAYLDPAEVVTITAPGYSDLELTAANLELHPNVIMIRQQPNLWFRFRKWLHQFISN
jgi:hypothetical protein